MSIKLLDKNYNVKPDHEAYYYYKSIYGYEFCKRLFKGQYCSRMTDIKAVLHVLKKID